MARSKSSKQWLKEHFQDPYVKQAQASGFRSRAAFKLLEIHQKDKLFKPGMTVIDLGAAPGGWSQIVVKHIGSSGKVLALDILPMDPISGVEFIQGDFTEPSVYDQVISAMNNAKADLVLSDIAPNMSGMAIVDQPRAMYLAELALEAAKTLLKSKGTFLVKVFQGNGFDQYLKTLRTLFDKVIIRKPEASRDRSREIYLLAKGFRVKDPLEVSS